MTTLLNAIKETNKDAKRLIVALITEIPKIVVAFVPIALIAFSPMLIWGMSESTYAASVVMAIPAILFGWWWVTVLDRTGFL